MEQRKSSLEKKFSFGNIMVEGSIGVFLAVFIFSMILAFTTDGFLTSRNMFSTSRAFSMWIIVGFAQMMALTIGHLNLSVGAIGGLAAVTVGWLFQDFNAPIWITVLTALGVGAACGAFNGILITLTGIHAFIITLGTSSVFLGLNYGLTKAEPFSTVPDAFDLIGRGRIFDVIPFLFPVMIIVAVALWFMYRHTVIGRRILAVGGNEDAAVLSGIDSKKIKILVHTLSGLIAGLAGVLFVGRLGAAHPTIGQNWLLISFAIPVIGGTTLEGGTTSIPGVVFGGILMTLLQTGLVLLEVNIFLEQFFMGILLLIAVSVDRIRAVYSAKRYT
ncbi:ABC transporter permease [Marispirochaeta aestuarii]|uniref:ABC transporter permease n=1 Tax=Marispirochaeta aestuarii TaxID=1963862 RepID=UPI002ABDD1E2|nr:ABC transporter permease [Marispirochaeta aestuarii]